MNRQRQNFSPSEFMEKLAHDDFSPSLSFVLTGMVRAAEDENHILFAIGFDCTNWIALPIEIIENIEWLYTVPCKDHTHPFVNLTIKEPDSEEAKVFATLARSLQSTVSRSPNMGDDRLAFQRMFRNPRIRERVFLRNSGPDEWYPCWSRCMDDLLEFASEQPRDQWLFWTDIAYQICGQVCP